MATFAWCQLEIFAFEGCSVGAAVVGGIGVAGTVVSGGGGGGRWWRWWVVGGSGGGGDGNGNGGGGGAGTAWCIACDALAALINKLMRHRAP